MEHICGAGTAFSAVAVAVAEAEPGCAVSGKIAVLFREICCALQTREQKSHTTQCGPCDPGMIGVQCSEEDSCENVEQRLLAPQLQAIFGFQGCVVLSQYLMDAGCGSRVAGGLCLDGSADMFRLCSVM
jgi:hypothetical protein